MPPQLLTNAYGPRDLTLVRGEGAHVWDSEGRRYLDCVSGIAVNALGHAYPPVVEAIQRQASQLIHVGNLYLQAPQIALAEKLREISGFPSVFFCNSGTEANEGALKFARKYWSRNGKPGKQKIICLKQSFHGRTYGSLAATGQEGLKQGFGPMPGGFEWLDLQEPESFEKYLNEGSLHEDALQDVAAILFEPILAEGGVISLTEAFIRFAEAAQAKGVLLLCDEVQTGLGRTGDFFGHQAYGLKPDVITLAKPLGGGLPLGAILVNEKVADSIQKGDHGSTFGGNPVACAAGLAVLETVGDEGFLQNVKREAAVLREKLETWVRKYQSETGFRLPLLGRGYLMGIDCNPEAPGLDVSTLITACRREGLLVHRAGPMLRLLPPLNIREEEVEELIAALERAARDWVASRK